jgi:oligopeptide/dipeptide ABC transporter ATP-binding protein
VIFQGAMNALNPLRTVGDQIAEPILLHGDGVTKGEAWARSRELLEQVGIPAGRASGYPHEFSGGMRQRVMIAMALACRPELVIADEPVTALDVMIQAQIMELLKQLGGDYALSMILISHDLSVLSELCDSIAVMYAGKIVEYGGAAEVFTAPKHPYTRGLMHAYPNIHGKKEFVRGIAGHPPNLLSPPPGCSFYERCPHRKAGCAEEAPALRSAGGAHFFACAEGV